MTLTSLSTGSTTGGAITQVVARGAMDFHLTGDAEVTHWRLEVNKHTNFACEHISQVLGTGGSVSFGATTVVTMTRTGDLVHHQYIIADLPGIVGKVDSNMTTITQRFPYELDTNAADDNNGDYAPAAELSAGLTNPLGGYWASYCQSVGHALIKKAQIEVGGHVIDAVTSDYLHMWEELSGKAGRKLEGMIGRHATREELIAYSAKPRQLYIPLPWWFTMVAGNALSLVSLLYHSVTVSVTFEELAKLIIVSNQDIQVNKTDANGNDSGVAIQNNDLNAAILSQYVYLDVAERTRFSNRSFDQLITRTHCHSKTTTESAVQIALPFNHPCIELMFACRLKANKSANKHFDFSRVGPSNGTGSGGNFPTAVAMQPQSDGTFDVIVADDNGAEGGPELVTAAGAYNIANVVTTDADPITKVSLKINHTDRFPPQEGRYFRMVEPWEKHSSIPRGYIYTYSFALYPEEPTPSGALNFSRIDNVSLDLEFHESISGSERDVLIFARSWNVFTYKSGIGGLMYQN
jgi:hypothetical protein